MIGWETVAIERAENDSVDEVSRPLRWVCEPVLPRHDRTRPTDIIKHPDIPPLSINDLLWAEPFAGPLSNVIATPMNSV